MISILSGITVFFLISFPFYIYIRSVLTASYVPWKVSWSILRKRNVYPKQRKLDCIPLNYWRYEACDLLRREETFAVTDVRRQMSSLVQNLATTNVVGTMMGRSEYRSNQNSKQSQGNGIKLSRAKTKLLLTLD